MRAKREGGAELAMSFETLQWIGGGSMVSPLSVLARRDVVLSAAMMLICWWQRELSLFGAGDVCDRKGEVELLRLFTGSRASQSQQEDFQSISERQIHLFNKFEYFHLGHVNSSYLLATTPLKNDLCQQSRAY